MLSVKLTLFLRYADWSMFHFERSIFLCWFLNQLSVIAHCCENDYDPVDKILPGKFEAFIDFKKAELFYINIFSLVYFFVSGQRSR